MRKQPGNSRASEEGRGKTRVASWKPREDEIVSDVVGTAQVMQSVDHQIQAALRCSWQGSLGAVGS